MKNLKKRPKSDAKKHLKKPTRKHRPLVEALVFTGTAVLGVIGTISLASASVPSRITDDTALYQNLSEIRVRKEADLSFDQDVSKLSKMESRYRERLPETTLRKQDRRSRVETPVKRISRMKYRPSVKASRSTEPLLYRKTPQPQNRLKLQNRQMRR